MAVGVDVGGTFTDLARWDGARLTVGKVPTTADQSDGVVAGSVDLTGGGPAGGFLHGTTVATNALLERAGARTALVTTAGFEDVVEIGRQRRPSLYDPFADRPQPLVPPELRFGFDGDADAVAARVAAAGPEAVAVCLLYSFADPGTEQTLAAALRRRLGDVPISISSGVVAEFREFERTSTTILNAYLSPATGLYLRRLVAAAAGAGLASATAVMRSSGGLMPAGDAAARPAAILLSGPAGGVVAASELGRALGLSHLISFDMGGTSTDVCRIDHGRPEVTYQRTIEGYPCRLPAVAIHTVGAGGGSIGWVDPGGALRVGPHSAGAHPGPACYGRGGEAPAVTDANLALGRLDPQARLAGTLRLQPAPATAALQGIGDRLGLGATGVAAGMIAVVEAHMNRAIRAVSVEQGADPRRSVLVAFGGAGGLHAAALARSLDMAGVVVPPYAGVFSALGLLLSPPRADAARTVLLESGAAAALDTMIVEVASLAARELTAAGGGPGHRIRTVVDARYRGQSHETSVPYEAGAGWDVLERRFHDAHLERNGFARPGDPVEAVTVRAEAVGSPVLTWDQLPSHTPGGVAERGHRPVLTASGAQEASVWWRPALAPGTRITGPAVIEDVEATTFLDRGDRAVVHDSGALEVEW